MPRASACNIASPHLLETPEIVGVASTTEIRSRGDPRLASLKTALSVVSEVEPYASRGARTVPGGEPTARWAPTRRCARDVAN